MASFLAVAANLGALALTDIPNKFYFLRLGGIIFFAAVTATLTNYFLVKREVAEEAEFVAQVKEAYSKKSDNEKIISEVENKKNILAKEISEVAEEKVAEVSEKISDKKISAVEEVEKVSDKKAVEEKVTVQKVAEEKIPEIQEKVLPTVTEKISKIAEEKVAEVSEKISDKKISVPEKKSAEKIVKPESKVEKVIEEKIDIKKIVESEEKLPPPTVEIQGETLDEILDYAYIEKQQGHSWQAIAAYKKALEKYRSDEYAPFVAIDLANIYKEQSFYTKAIKTIEDAMELPAVRRSSATKTEFKKNLIYLKTVQSVLLRHKALATPFSKISRAYLQEIESEFQAAQLKFEN